jgi:hypothetical protein
MASSLLQRHVLHEPKDRVLRICLLARESLSK